MAIKISYTLISQVVYNGNQIDYCPRRIYWEYLSPDVRFKYESDPMIQGQFFETLAIGCGRDGAAVTDLRRNKKNGSKRVVQTRIESQALEFKRIAKQKGIKIFNTGETTNIQWTLAKRWDHDENIIIEIHPDIVLTPYLINPPNGDPFTILATVDTKLTGKIDSTFGPHQWGDIDKKDLLQADLYSYVIRNLDLEWNKQLYPDQDWDFLFNEQTMKILENPYSYMFVYMIFETDRLERNKIHGRMYDPINEKQMHESIRLAVELYREMARNGFKPNPSYDLCNNCPIQHKCSEANINEKYE